MRRIIFSFVFVILFLAQSSASKASECRVALVIGNAGYMDMGKAGMTPVALEPLKAPADNAEDVAAELRRFGFDVTLGTNLKKEAMKSTSEEFYAKIQPGCASLVFFSGIGAQYNNENYLIPIDERIYSESDIGSEGFSLKSMADVINGKNQGGEIIFIVDASRRNRFERQFRPFSAGLAPSNPGYNSVVFYSSAPGLLILPEGDEDRIFVRKLLGNLVPSGRSLYDIFWRTKLDVEAATVGEDKPFIYRSTSNKDYFLQAAR